MTTKFVVKLGLTSKSYADKVDFGRAVVLAITGNSNFSVPGPPSLAELTTATDELQDAHVAAEHGGTLLTEQLHTKADVFDELMTAMGKYVDNIARGNREIILSAGMEAKKERSPQPAPDRVTGLEASIGKLSGSIDLDWDKMLYARVYLLYMRADSDSEWTFLGNIFPSKHTVSGLISGTRYWFKVEAQGTAGKSEASDPSTSLAY